MDALIRAAGGVLWSTRHSATRYSATRHAATHDVQRVVALVHRPRLDDWSLPKGKVKRGEHPLLGACREVLEETGVRPSVGARLPTVSYSVQVGTRDVDKVVDYWAMTVVADEGFRPGPETDALAWLPVDEALDRLSYERDITVVRAFAELPRLRSPVVLLRHAKAGERSAWRGRDERRPLDPEGTARAHQLVDLLRCFNPTRLVSASPVRCRQTLEPLARALGLPVEVNPAYDEDADTGSAADRLREVEGAVICSQGALIPNTLAALTGEPASRYRTAKGTGWVLSFAVDGSLAKLDPLP